MRFTHWCIAALVVVAMLCESAFAAWPSARWRKPVGFGPHGDVRPLMKKLHKQNPPFRPRNTPDPMADFSSKSRSYHFKYGPIYPEHHEHLSVEAGSFPAPDHKKYY